MGTHAEMKAVRATALAAKAAESRRTRETCEREGHVFKPRRVWCLRCKAARNPAFPGGPRRSRIGAKP